MPLPPARTSTGYNTGTWSASVDGVNFATLAGVNTATRDTNFIQRQVSFAALPALTDAPNVTLRYTLSGATNSTSNNRIDELFITATPTVTGGALRTVSIAAVDASANEATLDPATFAVQLNVPAPAGGLDVELFFGGGSATAPELPGGDYTLTGLTSYDPVTLTGHLFFLEGQSAALVTATPVPDAEEEYAETIVASVRTSPRYLLGSNSSAHRHDSIPTGQRRVRRRSAACRHARFRRRIECWSDPRNWRAVASRILPDWRTLCLVAVDRPRRRGGGSRYTSSNFDTLLGLYTGAGVASLTRIGVDDDSGSGLTSLIRVAVTQGVTYFIAVDGYGQSAGQIALSLAYTPVPVVSISAPGPIMKERGGVPGVVRFSLSNTSPLPSRSH